MKYFVCVLSLMAFACGQDVLVVPVPGPTVTATPSPKDSPSPIPSATPSATPSPSPTLVGEPAFCTPSTFYTTEYAVDEDGLDKAHAFQLGSLKLVGLAVGSSSKTALQNLAQTESNAAGSDKWCTWYMNDGESGHTKMFNWQYLSYPDGDIAPMVDKYERDFGKILLQTPNSFLACGERHRYIAFGCDGMSHRGPSAMAMFLGFLGCTPQHSREIAVHYWGRNGIKDSMREAMAARGKLMGDANPQARQRFLNLTQ